MSSKDNTEKFGEATAAAVFNRAQTTTLLWKHSGYRAISGEKWLLRPALGGFWEFFFGRVTL